MLEIAIAENVLRADLNPLEEAEGYRQMMDAVRLLGAQAGRSGSARRAAIFAHRLRILRAAADVQALVRERPDTLRYVAPLHGGAGRGDPPTAGGRDARGQADQQRHRGARGRAGGGERRRAMRQVEPAAPRRPGLRRDRLSTATRALSHFLGSKRLPLDADTAAHMLQLRAMIDRYLARLGSAESGRGAMVDHV